MLRNGRMAGLCGDSTHYHYREDYGLGVVVIGQLCHFRSMKAISLSQLHYVVEVAAAGHFGRAAKVCHVTQPTLSMQIQKLEGALGFLLFERTEKPIRPTPTGLAVVALAKEILDRVRQVELSGEEQRHEVQGEFSLGVIPTLAPYLLPRFLQPLSDRYRKLHLTIEEIPTATILERLENNSLDAGLLAIPLGQRGMVEVPLFKEPFLAYVSDGHRLQKKKGLTAKDMSHEDLWLLNEGHCFRDQVLDLCQFRHQSVASKRINFESGNLETLKKLVERKSGYTLLPWLATLDLSPKQKQRSLRHFALPPPVRLVGLMHRQSAVKSATLAAIKAEILKAIPAELLAERSKGRVLPVKSI